MKSAGAFGHRLVEQVLLRADVRVERALLHAHRLGEVADRGAVVTLLGEQSRRLAGQFVSARGHCFECSAERVRNTSAAAWWKPAGSPAAEKVAAISSISPTHRQPFAWPDRAARSDRSSSSGSDPRHSSSRIGSTSAARASSRIAIRSAAVPLVQAAYAIFTADAAPTSSETTRASTAEPAKRSRTPATAEPAR